MVELKINTKYRVMGLPENVGRIENGDIVETTDIVQNLPFVGVVGITHPESAWIKKTFLFDMAHKGDCMKTDYQRFRVYGRNGCMGEFYSYGFDIESSRNIFALMKKEKVKILYQMPITKICNDGGSVVYENEEANLFEGLTQNEYEKIVKVVADRSVPFGA